MSAMASSTDSAAGGISGVARLRFMGAPFDPVPHESVVRLLEHCDDTVAFRYIVTPNVDHVVRLSRDSALHPLYADAWLSLCDSKPVSLLARLLSVDLPLVTGADLTLSLFSTSVQNGDTIILVAADARVVDGMRFAFPGLRFRSHVPPPNVWRNPQALQECVDFVAQERARFVLLAIGSPQSEKIAHMLLRDGRGRGVGLCIGAGLEFLLGLRRRAPSWMRRLAIEWLHRFATDPRRLWRRYVFGVLPLAGLLAAEVLSKIPTFNR